MRMAISGGRRIAPRTTSAQPMYIPATGSATASVAATSELACLNWQSGVSQSFLTNWPLTTV